MNSSWQCSITNGASDGESKNSRKSSATIPSDSETIRCHQTTTLGLIWVGAQRCTQCLSSCVACFGVRSTSGQPAIQFVYRDSIKCCPIFWVKFDRSTICLETCSKVADAKIRAAKSLPCFRSWAYSNKNLPRVHCFLESVRRGITLDEIADQYSRCQREGQPGVALLAEGRA